MPENDDLTHRFGYHPPRTPAVVAAHEATRASCLALAYAFEDRLPAGPEKDAALVKVEEAMFWANAAIARANAVPEPTDG